MKLVYDNNTRESDIDREGGNIITDDTLYTVVTTSLFTDRLALPDDEIPDGSNNRRGWWADPYDEEETFLIGSRWWLLDRSKTTQEALNKAKQYTEEALAWLITKGVAQAIEVFVERQGEWAVVRVEITKPGSPVTRWVGIWKAHLNLL